MKERAVLAAFAIVLLFASSGRTQETTTRRDALGDPLPAGALVRYSTNRLRHEQPVQAVAFSPDGRFISSSARDFNVRVWDRTTGELVHSLLKPTNRLAYAAPEASTPCLRYTPDGKYLVAGRGDANLLVWETAGYKLVHQLTGSTGAIHALAIAPDSKTCASADSEQIVRLWNLMEGKEIKQLTVQERAAVLTFSTDGGQLIAGCNDGSVRLWQLDSLTLSRVIEAHESAVQHLALAPGRATIASAAVDKTIRFWDVRPEANPQLAPLFWAGLPGSRLSAVGTLFGGLHFLALNREIDKLTCDEEPVRGLNYLPNGTLLTGGQGGLTLWNVQTRKPLRQIASSAISCLAVDSAGRVAVTGDNNGVVRLWNLESAQELILAAGPLWPPRQIVVISGGAKIAIDYRTGPILLWDAASGKGDEALAGDSKLSNVGAISADGTLAAEFSPAGIAIYELASGKKRTTIATTDKNISVLAVNSRSQLLAAGSEDKTISIWSLTDGHLTQRMEGLSAPLRTLLFTPDGKTLAGCPGNDTLILWDAATGKELRRLVESGAEIASVALSPDGSLAAMGHPDGAVRIWRMASGRLMHLLEGHPGPVRALAFSSDGRSLAAGSWLTLRLWEIASAKERLRLFDLPGEVTAAAITPGHEAVIVGMSNTQALRIPLEPSDLSVKAWNTAELDGFWGDLESSDATRAYRALTALAATPNLAVPLLRERQHPLVPLDETQRLRQTQALQKLDSTVFEEREKAARELEQLADAAEPALWNALGQNPTSEMRFRLLAILDKLQAPQRQRLRLRGLRCCELLERIAAPEAKKLLRELAGGAPGAWLTVAARSSLDRLDTAGSSASN
ncbi:MAG TPA: WD40 repeat domain-containing protein [Gemmataceae bacterium]|nr:WD40 repeat domain-containing protein [Gemmataceae bacterium]